MAEKTQDQIQKVINDAVPASCTIYAKSRTKSWSGSGFHIGNGYVVTAAHVATPDGEQNAEFNLSFDEQILHSANVIKSDQGIDAAILMINGDWSNIPSVMLANSDNLELGEIVAVIGAPEGWSDTVTVGRLSNMHQSMGADAPDSSWNDVMFVDAKILQGVSGGMCIGTDGLVIGSVIGVVGMLAEYGVGQNVVCPSNKIIQLIQSIKQ